MSGSVIQSVAVFCGSSKGFSSIYTDAARQLGQVILRENWKLIYGAGNVGLMGVLADEVLAGGGQVMGTIPQFLVDKEVAHQGIQELVICDTMHERKLKMVEAADAFISIPGGFGTLDECFEILTWRQLNIHSNPVAIWNVNGYFDSLIQQMEHMVKEGFLKKENKDLLLIEEDLDQLIEAIKRPMEQAEDKWIG